MATNEELKKIVKEKYTVIAEQAAETNASSCCGATSACCGDGMTYSIMADDYTGRDGYVADADLALGCGIPTDYAGIRPGMTVLDLGSGAGNDVFIAAREVGADGFVIGVDMTDTMITKANENKTKLDVANVDFRLGEIEALPVEDSSVDVIISNCVLNLVPDKAAAFAEMYRVLKSGGSFTVSDIVVEGDLPDELRDVAELYAGCVSGAVKKDVYLAFIREAGFSSIEIPSQKAIHIPQSVIDSTLAGLPEQKRNFNNARLVSVTVRAVKQRR
ncbi:MAG: arsenite S-adenosylmethyltransferase [Ignavibacteria bacterium]|nr:MAG: arsenite S-adenosylmethyltransferase [Ignavibacteria bacterium]